MIRSNFLNEVERNEFRSLLRRQNEKHGIARRANAFLLLDKGMGFEEVCDVLFLDDETVHQWHKIYVDQGREALFSYHYKGKQSCLKREQEEVLSQELEANIYSSTGSVCNYIEASFGITYSHSGCTKLLHRLNFEYKKPKPLPKLPSEEVQRDFIRKYEKLLNSLSPDEAVYFADAVHPEYQVKAAYGWFKKQKGVPIAIKTTTSRERLNIHGAINLENFHTPFVTADRINSHSSIALLKKIEAENPDKKRICVIWDGAAYHKSDAVKKWLSREDCRIHLIKLPPYCPHFNASERLWGVMHENVTHNRCYESFGQFKNAILNFLTETIPEKWHQFVDSITDNFSPILPQNFRIL